MNVDALKSAKQQAIDNLFINQNGRKVQRFGNELHNEKLTKIRQQYNDSLGDIMQQASERQKSAQAILDRVGNPYAILDNESLQRAALLSPFVAADISQLDAPGMVETAQNAVAWNDPAVSWLVGREIGNRFPADAGPMLQAKLTASLREIETGLDPKRASELSDARLAKFEAERDYSEAQQAGDAWKQHIADAYKVQPELVPG